jgi:flagellar biosynthesis protein FlhF
MHLKRYRGKTLKDALRAVRQDLGPDALVLSTQVVQDRGPRGWLGGTMVEVAAAIERQDVSDARHTVNDPVDREDPVDRGVEALAARLGASGLEPAVARAIAASHPAEHRRLAGSANLQATLTEQLRSLAAMDDDFAPVEVFVGPPGAGKTTTIAKIAAQQRGRQGRRLGLVAADGHRVGAVSSCGSRRIIGAPLTVRARWTSRLPIGARAGRSSSIRRAVHRATTSTRMFRRRPAAGIRTHLVLPASMPPAHVRRTSNVFRRRVRRVVITRSTRS